MTWDCRHASTLRSRQHAEVVQLYAQRKADRVAVDDGLWAACWREVREGVDNA